MLYDSRGNPLPPSPDFPLADRFDGYTPTRQVTPEHAAAVEALDQYRDGVISGERRDGFINELSGIGNPLNDKSLGGSLYGPSFALTISSFAASEARYRGSDLGRAVVDKIPDEMTRRGWDVEVQPDDADDTESPDKLDHAMADPRRAAAGWRAIARRDSTGRGHALRLARRWDAFGADPTQPAPTPPPGPLPEIDNTGTDLSEAIETWAENVPNNVNGRGLTPCINLALKYERAYGGGCVFIGVDDGGMLLTTPLDLSKVRKVTHFTVLRGGYDGEVTMWRPYRFAVDRKYGLPEIFQVRNSNVPIAPVPWPGENPTPALNYPNSPTGPTLFGVHESRFLIFDGQPTSIEARQEMRGWGDSIFTRISLALANFEQNRSSTAILMQEASVASIGIKGFTEALASKDNKARDFFIMYARTQSIMRSTARTNYHDAEQTFARQSVSFGGIGDILDRDVERIAAISETPISVLFGNLKGGLGASEDPSARGWYATVGARQESRARTPLEYAYRIGWRSKEGPTRGVEPRKWTLIFRPLWQLTELEQADLRAKTSTADGMDITNQIVTPPEVTATRYGGAEYNAGPIVIDVAGRKSAMARQPVPKPVDPAAPTQAAPDGPQPIKMMPTDPWTGTPAGTPSGAGETPNGVPEGTPGGRADSEEEEDAAEHAPAGSPEGGQFVGGGSGGGKAQTNKTVRIGRKYTALNGAKVTVNSREQNGSHILYHVSGVVSDPVSGDTPYHAWLPAKHLYDDASVGRADGYDIDEGRSYRPDDAFEVRTDAGEQPRVPAGSPGGGQFGSIGGGGTPAKSATLSHLSGRLSELTATGHGREHPEVAAIATEAKERGLATPRALHEAAAKESATSEGGEEKTHSVREWNAKANYGAGKFVADPKDVTAKEAAKWATKKEHEVMTGEVKSGPYDHDHPAENSQSVGGKSMKIGFEHEKGTIAGKRMIAEKGKPERLEYLVKQRTPEAEKVVQLHKEHEMQKVQYQRLNPGDRPAMEAHAEKIRETTARLTAAHVATGMAPLSESNLAHLRGVALSGR